MLIFSYCMLVAFLIINLNLSSSGLGLFGSLLHATPITQSIHMFLFFVVFIIIQLTAFYPRKLSIKNYSYRVYTYLYKYVHENTNIIGKFAQQFKIIEYSLIILFIVTGGIFIMSSSDIVSIFLSIELQSYGLYLLATLYKDSEASTSAGLTYFLLGGLSSCFILMSTALLYANSATTSLDGYYVIIGVSHITDDYIGSLFTWYDYIYVSISLIILSVGFLFKVSAAPFHNWSPDVYDAIPTIVTTFIAITPKISILAFLLELINHTSNLLFSVDFSWKFVILLSSLLSLIIGAILGLSQTRIKRLFAYSTISHLGFILVTIIINKSESTQAFVFYLTQYSISNLNGFVILLAMGYTLYPYINKKCLEKEHVNESERNNTPIQLISQLKGFFYLNPLLAISFAITFFSFIGIPPLAGFFAKQMVLSAALNNGYNFIVLIAIITSVISAAYYLNIIKQVFFDINSQDVYSFKNLAHYFKLMEFKNNDKTYFQFGIENITLSTYITTIISILTLAILLFMLASHELLGTIWSISLKITFNT